LAFEAFTLASDLGGVSFLLGSQYHYGGKLTAMVEKESKCDKMEPVIL
jgi:hypothetical protein